MTKEQDVEIVKNWAENGYHNPIDIQLIGAILRLKYPNMSFGHHENNKLQTYNGTEWVNVDTKFTHKLYE
jgi:hypothetical protein